LIIISMLNSPIIYQTYLSVFTPQEIEQIKQRARQEEMTPGRVGGENYDVDGVLKKELRDSNNYYFGEPWVYQKLQGVIFDANKQCGWMTGMLTPTVGPMMTPLTFPTPCARSASPY